MNQLDNQLEDTALKNRILSQNNTFKTAFTATLGFYAAQTVVTVLGFGSLSLVIYVVYKIVT